MNIPKAFAIISSILGIASVSLGVTVIRLGQAGADATLPFAGALIAGSGAIAFAWTALRNKG